MRVRSILAGLATTAVTASAATMIAAAPASADPAATPDANDIVGVGSATTENALDNLADGAAGIPGSNAGRTASDALLASFDTEGSATITLRTTSSGTITRPVGSGAGKALLFGGSNNPDVSFARSSSALSATEVSGGLKAFPFALDTLGMAVSGSVASHAPAGLSGAQILDIYKGTTTNWNEVGGTNGTIKPYIPQAGSGTRSFFDAQLKALNNGVAVTYGLDVNDTMHENTDTVLASDPDAIAPFSVGKQQTLYPTTVKLESLTNGSSGWSAQRALYNVVRSSDLADGTIGPRLQAIFGEDGFVCSTAARGLIEAAGFQQLALASGGHHRPDLQLHRQLARRDDHCAEGEEYDRQARHPDGDRDRVHRADRLGRLLRGRHPAQERRTADLRPGDPDGEAGSREAHLHREVRAARVRARPWRFAYLSNHPITRKTRS